MKKPPTDLKILEYVYKEYYPAFISYTQANKSRSSKVYVPINIDEIAKNFKVDKDIIFGRFYYHLEPKFSFKQPNGSEVYFFSPYLSNEDNVIQFPLLASVIANLKEERNKHLLATWLSIVAIGISILSFLVLFHFVWVEAV